MPRGAAVRQAQKLQVVLPTCGVMKGPGHGSGNFLSWRWVNYINVYRMLSFVGITIAVVPEVDMQELVGSCCAMPKT